MTGTHGLYIAEILAGQAIRFVDFDLVLQFAWVASSLQSFRTFRRKAAAFLDGERKGVTSCPVMTNSF